MECQEKRKKEKNKDEGKFAYDLSGRQTPTRNMSVRIIEITARGSVVVEALCYKPGVHEFETRGGE
jgi:hypothetical protein